MEELKEPLIKKEVQSNVTTSRVNKSIVNQRSSNRQHLKQVDDTDTDHIAMTFEDAIDQYNGQYDQSAGED